MKPINDMEYANDDFVVKRIVTDDLWDENCYLVTHRQSGAQVIVDPGWNPEKLLEIITANGNGTLQRILLTHGHFDHVGAVAALEEHFNIPCEVHKGDARLIKHVTMYGVKFGKRPVYPPKNILRFETEADFNKPDVFNVRFFPVPGHSKGSVVYVFDGFAFTGDTLLYRHVGRTDLPGANPDHIHGSIRELLNRLPGEIVMFPGHHQAWTAAEAKEWWETLEDSPPEHRAFSIQDQLKNN